MFCKVKQMPGFYMKRKTMLKQVKKAENKVKYELMLFVLLFRDVFRAPSNI